MTTGTDVDALGPLLRAQELRHVQLRPVYVPEPVREEVMHGPSEDAQPEEDKHPHGTPGVGRPRQDHCSQDHQERGPGDVGHALDKDRPKVSKRRLVSFDGSVDTEKQVVGVLPGTVPIVVAKIPNHRIPAVGRRTFFAALSGACKVRLEGASTRIALRHGISVVGPDVAEHGLELLELRGGLQRTQEAEGPHLTGQHPTGQCGLNHVGPVEAVHAIGPDHGTLLRDDAIGLRRVHMAVSLLDESVLQLIYEDLYPVPPHAFTFVMKVKVDIVNLPIAQLAYDILKGLLYRQLVSLLVDEVHAILVAIELDLLIEVQAGCNGRVFLTEDSQPRLVLQIVHLRPVSRDTPAGLDVRQSDLAVDNGRLATGVHQYQLLRLVEIGDISLCVDAPSKVSGPGTVPTPPGDQDEGHWLVLQHRLPNLQESVRDRQNIAVDIGVILLPAVINQVVHEISVPEETLIRSCPERI